MNVSVNTQILIFVCILFLVEERFRHLYNIVTFSNFISHLFLKHANVKVQTFIYLWVLCILQMNLLFELYSIVCFNLFSFICTRPRILALYKIRILFYFLHTCFFVQTSLEATLYNMFCYVLCHKIKDSIDRYAISIIFNNRKASNFYQEINIVLSDVK